MKYCMEDKNQGMFLTVWWGEIAIDSDWEEQMAMNYENRALLLLQPLLQLPQLSSFPSDRRAPGQPQMSQTCVCTGISGEPQFFLFVCVTLLQGLKRVAQALHPKDTLSLALNFPSAQDVANPDQHSVAGWYPAGGISTVSKQGWYWHPPSGAPKVLSWCWDAEKEPVGTPTLKTPCLYSLEDPHPRMHRGHTAEHQEFANTLKPVGYLLALVNSPLWLWETPQPLSNAGLKLQQNSGSRRTVFWAGDWPRYTSRAATVWEALACLQKRNCASTGTLDCFFLQKT